MLRKAFLVGQALAIALCASPPALADVPREVRLDYERLDGAAACPDDAAIRSGVVARLGYEPFRDQAGDRLRATIREAGQGLEARIELADAQGNLKAERRLVALNHDCAELASAVELAIAIAIDPVVSAAPPSEAPPSGTLAQATARAPGSGTHTGAEATAPAASAVTTSTPITERIEVGIMGGVGWAPAANLGLRVGAGLQGETLSLGIEARADLPASTPLRVGEASAMLLVASVVPCGHLGMAAACALVTAGAERVAGHGLLDSRRATLPYLGLGVRLALALPIIDWMALTLHGDVTAPVTQAKLTVDEDVVWTSPRIAFALGLGLVIRFP